MKSKRNKDVYTSTKALRELPLGQIIAALRLYIEAVGLDEVRDNMYPDSRLYTGLNCIVNQMQLSIPIPFASGVGAYKESRKKEKKS